MGDRVYNVLFLCTGNSARSILAEAILARAGAGQFRAFSAGSFPKGRVHPAAIHVLDNLGYDTTGFRSKSLDEFSASDAPQLDFIFTVCDNAAGEICPVWPGRPMTAHWGIPDPAAVEGSDAVVHAAFFDAYRMLKNRIELFLALPLASIDRMSLQAKLDGIASRADEPANAG